MIVKLQGGLGNQMFQYAYGLTESRKRNEELFLDTSLLEIGEPRRKYELGAYVDAKFKNDPSAEEGYWQGERYFDKDLAYASFHRPIRDKMMYTTALWAKEMNGGCFIGVRRGDYLLPERLNFHGIMPIEYYREAIRRMQSLHGDIPLFVFTNYGVDDVAWCQDNLPGEVVAVNAGYPAWDIWLMSLCSHAIIANSSFHWWGAYLGPDRRGGTVIAPKKWFVNEKSEIVPERWITL